MKKIIMLFWMSLVVLMAYPQEENSVDKQTTQKLSKEERKEQRKVNKEEYAKMVDWMVNHKRFVLEANYLSNKIGERVIVSNRLNFIAVDSNKITIQLASVSGIGGQNGMGGVTADGMITKYDVKNTGKGGKIYNIQIYTMTHIGTYDILLTISPDGNADATIGGSWNGKLSYHGYLVPIEKSKVFKGMSI